MSKQDNEVAKRMAATTIELKCSALDAACLLAHLQASLSTEISRGIAREVTIKLGKAMGEIISEAFPSMKQKIEDGWPKKQSKIFALKPNGLHKYIQVAELEEKLAKIVQKRIKKQKEFEN